MEFAKNIPPEKWLYDQIERFEEHQDSKLYISVTDDGKEFSMAYLLPQQKEVVAKVMGKIHE